MLILNFKIISILFILINNVKSNESANISIGFLIEEIQNDLLQDIPILLKKIEFNQNIHFIDSYIIYKRYNLNDTMENFCNVISKPISLIIDLTYSSWDQGIDLLKISQIPYIHMDISINSFIESFESFIKYRNGHDAAIIIQNEKHFEEAIYYIVTKYSDLRWGIYNGMENNFVEKLKNIKPLPSYFGIFANRENMKHLINKINETDLLKRSDKWHLIFLDVQPQYFYFEKYINFHELIPVKEFACKLLYSKNSNCFLPEDFTFPMATLHEVLTNILNTLKATNFEKKSLNCSIIIDVTDNDMKKNLNDLANTYSNNNFLKISNDIISCNINMSIYLISNETIPIATWYDHKLVPIREDYIKPARKFYRIGTSEALPWSVLKRDPITLETILDKEGNVKWEGYCIEFIEKLSKEMDFDYEIIIPKKGTFGDRQSDKSWDGLIGDLISGEIQIAIGALKMTSEREEVIDFVVPYFETTGISIVIKNAVKNSGLFKFMTVLRLEVWLSVVAALVSAAVMLWLLDTYSPYSAINNKNAYPYPCREFTLSESFWFALTSFTPQGGGETPKAISGRVLVASYWLFVALMVATFTANLAAFLTVERMQAPVSSLEQLAKQSRINYTVVEGSDTHEYFINMKYAEDTLYRIWKELSLNTTSDPRRFRIWDYPIKEQYGHILLAINTSNPVKNANEGFQRVIERDNADFAFIHDAAEIKYAATKNCNLTEIGQVFGEQPYAVAVQQGSSLQDELSYVILELQQDNYFEHLREKYFNNKTLCSNDKDDNEGITLERLGGVFIATFFGIGLAVIIMIIEIIYYKRKDDWNFKKSVAKIRLQKLFKNVYPGKLALDKNNYNYKKNLANKVNFGIDDFKPTKLRRSKIVFISVNPRNASNLEEQGTYCE